MLKICIDKKNFLNLQCYLTGWCYSNDNNFPQGRGDGISSITFSL